VQRSLNRARSQWTLVGLAARIAHGLNLHRDGDGRAFSAFEAEMRRRLWWQILALDLRASQDRGSDSTFAETSFSTIIPCNIDDEDFSYDTPHPLKGRNGPTDMTPSLLSMDALHTSRKISSRPSVNEPEDLTLQQREDMVRQYAERIESTYLADGVSSNPRTRLLRLMGHYWMCKLWLALYYPLHHRLPSQQVWSRTQGLQTAVTLLNVNDFIERDPSSFGLAWHFKAYVPWHAVAVTLAELCNQPQSLLADRAWEIVQRRFEDWNARVADVKEAMLWGPVKKLLKRAHMARQQCQESVQVSQALHPSDLDSLLQGFDAHRSSKSGPERSGGSGLNAPQPLDAFGPTDHIVGQPLDFLASFPMDTTMDGPEAPDALDDLDNWNDFTLDVNTLGEDFLREPYIM